MSLSITIPKQLNINGWIPVLYRKKGHYLMSILTTWANLETNNWLAAPPCGDVTDWAVIFTENQQLIKGLRRAPFQRTPEMEATKKKFSLLRDHPYYSATNASGLYSQSCVRYGYYAGSATHTFLVRWRRSNSTRWMNQLIVFLWSGGQRPPSF